MSQSSNVRCQVHDEPAPRDASEFVGGDGRRLHRHPRRQQRHVDSWSCRRLPPDRRRLGDAPRTTARLDLPLRATGDADFGVPPHVLRSPDLVEAIEELGYRKVLGNRWERQLDERRVAAVKDTRMLANHYRHQVRPTIDAALILGDVLNPSS